MHTKRKATTLHEYSLQNFYSLGNNIWQNLTAQLGDFVSQSQFTFFQSLQFQLVEGLVFTEAFNDIVEVAVFTFQLMKLSKILILVVIFAVIH